MCTVVAMGVRTGPAAAATPPTSVLTTLDGEAFLLRDSARLALAEGVALKADDLFDVPAQARLARLEQNDGVDIALGPDTRALLAPRLAGARGGARLYLLSGWLKLSAPAGTRARVLSPWLDVSTAGGTVVLWLHAAGASLFAEAGEATVQRPAGGEAVVLQPGELFSVPAGGTAPPERADRPSRAFLGALPRTFMDKLPSRLARWRDQAVEPQAAGALSYAHAQPWIDAEPALRRAYLARWRPLARQPEFRRGLVSGLKNHPEWGPILSPPEPRRPPY
ncbi:hypothetical protein ASF44_18925 [Pseudorhodoferax sp. Leaf274]|nr:hypothetical protein ASF44_18925 [Pseudorhodoferax sp. Leaf274]